MTKSTKKQHDSHFATDHLSSDLKDRSVRGGIVTLVGQGAKFILQFGSTMMLARILTPEDFGIVAMVAAVTGFVLVFKDLGLSMATVQQSEINHHQISTLFWINVAISFALMLTTMALAPVIAWFYQDPRLVWVTVGVASAFIFGGLTVQHQALLRRQMRFLVLTGIDVTAIAAGVIAGVVCGLAGLGYWSLVVMQLVTAIATTAGVWLMCSWRPGRMVRKSGVRPMLSFGGYMTGFSVVNYFARNLDGILLGRFAGAGATGLYTRAYSLLLLPIAQITAPISAVAVPTLSRLQSEPDRYRNYYLRAITLIAYTTMPLVVAMAILAPEIVAVVLGDQWAEAADLFRVLAVVALLQPIGATVGWVYVSLGQTRRMFVWVCIAAPIILLFFVIGIRWGAIGVAYGYAIANCILICPQMAYALRYSPIRLKDVLMSINRPLLLSISMGVAMAGVYGLIEQWGVIETVMASLATGAVTLLVILGFSSAIREDIKGMYSTSRMAWVKA